MCGCICPLLNSPKCDTSMKYKSVICIHGMHTVQKGEIQAVEISILTEPHILENISAECDKHKIFKSNRLLKANVDI